MSKDSAGITGRKESIAVSITRHPFLAGLVINAAILVLTLAVFYPHFETNDDFGINRLVDGSRGNGDPHLVYSNIVLGLILRLFYSITGSSIPWYTFIQFAILFLAFTGVSWALFINLSPLRALLITVLVSGFFGYECYVNMQYTKTAGIAAAAGLFLLAFSMTMKDSKKGLFVLSVFLVCAGVMYRPMEAFACLLICGGAFLVVFFKKQINIRKILIPVVMISVLLIVDKAAYGLDDGWKEWKRYNEVRSDLLDYGLPDYQSHEQVLNDAGITRSAFDLLASWNFADPDVLTAEKLEIIQSLKEPRPFINGDLVRAYFKTVSPGLFRYLTFYPLLLIAVLAFAGRKRLKDFLFVLFWVLVTFNGVYYFLFANGRYLMRRVDTGLFFAAAMAFLFLVHNKSLNKGTAVISLAVMAVTGSVYAFNGPTAYLRGGAAVRQLNDLTAASREVLDETTGDKEHLYLVQMGALSDSLSFRIFESPGPGELDNVIWLGGWDIYTPSWHEAKQAFGVSNPYRDCIDRDDILIVAGNTDLLLRYFHDYYGGDIEMVPDHNVGNAVAYHVIRTQK